MKVDNNKSCNNLFHFIDKTLLERVCSGTISVLGMVGEVDPKHLIMHLIVEMSKPRLCHDNHFLNLWITYCPFRLNNLSIKWRGWYFVSNSIPFGWKTSHS